MDLDTWIEYYRSLGYTIAIEDDGGQPAWFVCDDKGEMVDWWWLSAADQFRPLDSIPNTKPG